MKLSTGQGYPNARQIWKVPKNILQVVPSPRSIIGWTESLESRRWLCYQKFTSHRDRMFARTGLVQETDHARLRTIYQNLQLRPAQHSFCIEEFYSVTELG